MSRRWPALPFRPLSECLDAGGFSLPPSALPELVQRLNVNLSYYCGNYLLLVLLAQLYTAWARGLVFIVCLLAGLSCGASLLLVRRAAVVVAGRQVSRQELLVLYCLTLLAALLWSGGAAFALPLLLSVSASLLHAGLRSRSVKAKTVSFLSFVKRDLLLLSKPDETEDEAEEAHDPEMGRGGGGGGRGRGGADGLNGSRAAGEAEGEQEILRREQAKFRANFRQNMRAKYLQRAD